MAADQLFIVSTLTDSDGIFNVRTTWHGSADVSPVGHACNFMLDMNVWNFGIQEAAVTGTRMRP